MGDGGGGGGRGATRVIVRTAGNGGDDCVCGLIFSLCLVQFCCLNVLQT